MATERDFDLFVIGAGSAGVRAARMAAATGARVAVAEERDMGGTCVNVGCIPKKLLVYASHFATRTSRTPAGYGWSVGDAQLRLADAASPTRTAEIERPERHLRESGARRRGSTRIEGRARVEDAHTAVAWAASRDTLPSTILVATWRLALGCPTIPGIELAITSNEVFHLAQLPERVLVVGGGYIAVEFAGILHGSGAEVDAALPRSALPARLRRRRAGTTLAEEMRKTGRRPALRSSPCSVHRADAATGVRADPERRQRAWRPTRCSVRHRPHAH